MTFLIEFLQKVKILPTKIAIKKGNQSLTYSELWNESLKVYTYLKQQNYQGELVGIDAEDGIYSYAYIVGVWLYGAAYVPLNPLFPEERNQKIIREAGLNLVFSSRNNWGIPSESIDNLTIGDFDGTKINTDLAYVLFTSGSTDVPKGVKISKANLDGFLGHYMNPLNYKFSQNDRFLQSYELTFDVSVFCFTLPLMLGGTLVLLPDAGIKYLSILQSLEKEKITVTSNVPSTLKFSFNRLQELTFPDLRYSFFSGEALFGNWAKKWMNCAPNAKVYNCYGPTETTIVCTAELLNNLPATSFDSKLPLPLGTAFENMDLVLINNEICFAGDLVFPGYLNQKKPEIIHQGKTYFPTGDLAELDANNKLIFKGRKDRQIQLNGYRIELDEIDLWVQNYLKCSSKTFLLSKQNGEQFLLCAIESKQINEEKIKLFLAENLPPYSIPKHFIALEKFPYNNNQKLDVKKLEELVNELTNI